ncbi:MAG: PAS domain-containing protein [Gemmatimonadaceae bacterium]
MSTDLLSGNVALTIAAVAVVAYAFGRRNRRSSSVRTPLSGPGERSAGDDWAVMSGARAFALDAVSEAVLIVQSDGRVRDCNSAALALFQRHRGSIQDVFVPTLRSLEADAEAYRVARERGLWTGEAWVRLPDGAVTLCTARLVPLPDGRGSVGAFAETYRDAVSERLATQDLRDRLFGVRQAVNETTDTERAEEALVRLGESFRDLELAVQHYEHVVAALRISDPATETVAGLVHESMEASANAGTQALLREVPQLLARLKTHLDRLERLSPH